MKKKLLLIFSLLLIFPLTVKADGEPNVTELNAYAEDNGNIILFGGETENNSHAVMCKLYNNSEEEIDKLSVEVTNTGSNGTFGGSFVAPSTGDYRVSCANYEGGTIVTDDVTVSTLTQVTVEFNTNGGSAIAPVNVTVGQTVARPEDPTKDGKVFGGWYEDGTFTRRFDFNTRITAFTTIYAKWNDPEEVQQSQIHIQVIFDGGGTYQIDFDTDNPENQGPMNAQINHTANYFVDHDTEVTLTAVPSEGHHLAGWYSAHEEEDPNNPGQMIWVEDEQLSNQTEYVFTPEGEYINIKLVFEENAKATVEFNTCGGSEIAPIEVEIGQTIARPEDPTNGDQVFAGWFEDATFTRPFDFNNPITESLTIYAKWEDGPTGPEDPEEPTIEQEKYNLKTGNDEVTFMWEENRNLRLVITDLGNLPDEALATMNPPMDRETYEAVREAITEAAKKYGTLIYFLDISVLDEHDDPIDIENEVIVKLGFTEEMEGYKYYKLIYLEADENDNILLGKAYTMTKEKEQLVGKLPHLSAYVLVGSNTEEGATTNTTANSSKTPNTYDGIITWIIALIISVVGLTTLLIANKKKTKVE